MNYYVCKVGHKTVYRLVIVWEKDKDKVIERAKKGYVLQKHRVYLNYDEVKCEIIGNFKSRAEAKGFIIDWYRKK